MACASEPGQQPPSGSSQHSQSAASVSAFWDNAQGQAPAHAAPQTFSLDLQEAACQGTAAVTDPLENSAGQVPLANTGQHTASLNLQDLAQQQSTLSEAPGESGSQELMNAAPQSGIHDLQKSAWRQSMPSDGGKETARKMLAHAAPQVLSLDLQEASQQQAAPSESTAQEADVDGLGSTCMGSEPAADEGGGQSIHPALRDQLWDAYRCWNEWKSTSLQGSAAGEHAMRFFCSMKLHDLWLRNQELSGRVGGDKASSKV